MAENFDLIFGQNASQQYAWSDNDYQNGWGTIGNIPPTAAQFDALQRRSDTKMKELNDELTPLVNAETADNRQPATEYSEGTIKYTPLLPTGWFLECTVAGTTSASDLVITSPAIGDTVTDGTVVWTIRKVADTTDATTTTHGLMSASDKTKLNGIAANANNYSLPTASASVKGGIKVGSGLSMSGETLNNAYTLPTASGSVLGGVKIGSNITNNSGTISLSKTNVTSALGYTPPTTNTTYNTGTASYSGITKLYTGVGDNTDGSMTQKAIKAIIVDKADRSLSNLTDAGIEKIIGSVVKGPNGYQRLGNGLIVQWGISQSPATYSAICSFPIEFSNTNFICIGIGHVLSTDATFTHTVNEMWDLRTTGRAVFRLSSADGPQVEYVAIGY